MLHDIIIGGVRIGFDAAHELTQTYEKIGGRIAHRMLNGAGVQQVHWTKLKTTIKGVGTRPAGLDGLNYDAAISISCAEPMSIWGASNTITLPASRRTDWTPHGYAIVNGQHQVTGVSVVGNTATLGAVSGAQGYVCAYYPIISVIAQPPQTEFSGRGVVLSWSITAEEV